MNQQEGRLGSPVVEGIWCCGAAPEVPHAVLGPQFKKDTKEQVKVQWRATRKVRDLKYTACEGWWKAPGLFS